MKLNTLKNKKGQTAVEYMVTYGWSLIVLGVVMVVLWQAGYFNPPATPPGCSGFGEVTPIDSKADDTGKLMLTILNDAGVKIRLDSISANVSNIACTTYSTVTEMRAGEIKQVNLTGCTFPGVSDYYKAEMIIEYTNLISTLPHKTVGECHGYVEPA